MNAEQVSACTGLTKEEAERALDRDCSEPLIWNDSKENLEVFTRLLLARDLHITRGGRFYHVASAGDKGLAVRWLTDNYKAEFPKTEFVTIGLGDGVNDIPMLEQVDYPVLVQAEHDHAPKSNHIKKLIITDVPGPAGWNTAVTRLVSELLSMA